ncbi:MAG: hypothetical protein DRP87_03745 [Spirochaetes bacterium]|nr:MAG: hypothetical protein DRP87_03745 [Spirochaetota bacterium]
MPICFQLFFRLVKNLPVQFRMTLVSEQQKTEGFIVRVMLVNKKSYRNLRLQLQAYCDVLLAKVDFVFLRLNLGKKQNLHCK